MIEKELWVGLCSHPKCDYEQVNDRKRCKKTNRRL